MEGQRAMFGRGECLGRTLSVGMPFRVQFLSQVLQSVNSEVPTNDWVPTQGLKTLHENILLYKETAN